MIKKELTMAMGQRIRTNARLLLAGIRLLNGSIALLSPGLITRQLGAGDEEYTTAHYALRMFGIRTILIAIDLLRPAGPARDHAIRIAPIIHASDTAAATLAVRLGTLSTGAALSVITISAVNTLLSLVMQPPRARRSLMQP
jgi:energy-converting hydrogenase Eha subunit E